MKPHPLCLVLLMVFPLFAIAQKSSQVASDAYMVTRMAEKFHTQPRPLDAAFSAALYRQFLRTLDEQHFLFRQEDVKRMEPFRLTLGDQIKQQRTDFLDLVTSIYRERVRQADSLIDRIAAQPVNLALLDPASGPEDDSTAPLNISGMRAKMATFFGLAVSAYVHQDLDSGKRGASRRLTDSLEAVERKKLRDIFKRETDGLTQSPGGLPQALGLLYCNTLASCYDPHTAFFSMTEKEQFEQALGNRKYVFGFALKAGDGGVVIDHVQPGSPAFKAGVLSEGDRLTAVQWSGKDPIDVSDAQPEEVNTLLDASNHDEITLTVKKADGTARQVSLSKEQAGGEEEESKVRGLILKGTQNIGYISLPAFYTDWDNPGEAIKGCAEDVAKEVLELKKENIGGLILDLRYNGGGSLQEAVDLVGLFIDAGPVAQVRARDEKPYVLKDFNRGTVYDGPLILLVNGYSASASELIAGSLQDYNRAVIVGTPTYGKATAQVVLPLDTNIDLQSQQTFKPAESFLKLTVERLYRVDGTSAQGTGVQPDILLPVPTGAVFQRESASPFALAATRIDANKYYRPYPPLPIADLQQFAGGLLRADTSAKSGSSPSFTMSYPTYEQKWLGTDALLKTENEEMEEALKGDVYLEIAYRVACRMNKP